MTCRRWVLRPGRLSFLGVLVMAGALAALPRPGGRAAEPDPEPPGAWPKTRPAHRAVSAGNLKQIALAFHNFHSTYGALPGVAIVDAKGKALLSWRVAILPFIEEDALYRQFHLDEPWDSKHNKKLLARMPKLYAPTVTGKPGKPNVTYYQAFTGPDALFNLGAVRRAGPISLGTNVAQLHAQLMRVANHTRRPDRLASNGGSYLSPVPLAFDCARQQVVPLTLAHA